MIAGLILSGAMAPVLAQQQSDPDQGLFPANLTLELTDEHITEDGRQVVAVPLPSSRETLWRETLDDLLFIEHAGPTKFVYRQIESLIDPKNVILDVNHRKKLNP